MASPFGFKNVRIFCVVIGFMCFLSCETGEKSGAFENLNIKPLDSSFTCTVDVKYLDSVVTTDPVAGSSFDETEQDTSSFRTELELNDNPTRLSTDSTVHTGLKNVSALWTLDADSIQFRSLFDGTLTSKSTVSMVSINDLLMDDKRLEKLLNKYKVDEKKLDVNVKIDLLLQMMLQQLLILSVY